MNTLLIDKNIIGFVFFLMIYPFDFFSYMVLVNYGFGVPIGFIGSLISIFLFFLFLTFEKNKNKILTSCMFLILAFGLFFLMWISGNAELLDYFYILKIIGAFFSGMLFINFMQYASFQKISKFLFIIWSIMLFLVFFWKVGENYLRLSDAFAIVSLFLLASLSKIKYQILLSLVSSIALYYLESRSGLFLFFITSIFMIFIRNNFFKFILLSLPIFFALFIYIQKFNSNIVNYNDNRFLRILFSTDTDTSLNARKYLNELGWKTYLDNKLYGDFGYYKYSLGEGSYAHNFISFLAEFGFLGVIFILFYFLFFIFCMYKFFRLSKKSDTDYLVLNFIIFAIIGLLFSKSFYWLFIFFILGLMVSYFFSNQKNIND